jgi:UDP-N-acetylglucosamine diphosphorylase/glucosamine-1-phosphate N-acetyltransferase
MNFVLFDDEHRNCLSPFTFTRPVAEIRIGILTIREKWEHTLKTKVSYHTLPYLSEKYPYVAADETIFINGRVCPDAELLASIMALDSFQALVDKNLIIAFRTKGIVPLLPEKAIKEEFPYRQPYFIIDKVWDIFMKNDLALREDFKLLTAGRISQKLSGDNTIIGLENVFVEEGASVSCSIINASKGPVYIGSHAEIMEGCMIRGPFALGKHATLKMGTKIYGATTIGPYSRAGGEINNVILFAYSNKGHDGYLGNSVIGEWCNLGADTNASNLKNNYASVQVWSYASRQFEDSGLTYCGLIMGDHSKCSINTMFNTGTVVGVNANIFGSGFPVKHIPSFSWGGAAGWQTYHADKAFEVAERVYERRQMQFSEIDRKILTHVFELTKEDRSV